MVRFTIFIAEILGISFLLIGCASKPPAPIFVDKCVPTTTVREDLKQFNVAPAADKVIVVRLFRSNSPYCREDLARIGMLFKEKTWSTDKVQLVLIAYKKAGVESKKTFDDFVRSDLVSLGIPLEATQMIFLDKNFPDLAKIKGKAGETVFLDWKAVPFGLVFAKDGRLAYRGHFTANPNLQDNQYRFIGELQNETCGQNPN